ncbi:MAG: hypothetical protein IMHGJWDQ_000771 [Candidatus Fervidibacter sp.]
MDEATRRKWVNTLTFAVLLYGSVVAVAYLGGWVSPRTCEGLSALPCFLVAGWYGVCVGKGLGTLVQRWGWALMASGWVFVGMAFLLPEGTGRLVALSSAVPTLLVGFLTTLLALWHEEGGTNS